MLSYLEAFPSQTKKTLPLFSVKVGVARNEVRESNRRR